MKELSIEQKAKAYDKAIEKAKLMIDDLRKGEDILAVSDLESMFPQLAESEDELTWLTKYIEEEAYNLSMDIRDNEDRIKLKKLQRSLTWLEKQSEPELSKDLSDYIAELSKQFPEVSFAKLSRIAVRIKNWFEKQGEENHADKIDPKFKVGDWITNGIETVQITGYDIDYGYQVDYKGKLQHRDTDIIEKEYHLWTIQDVKPDDVLVVNWDNGYKLDAKKKELKKIEQNPAWSEDDEKERKRVVGLLEGWLSTFKETCYAEDCKCGIDWLKSIKDRVIPQPKQEWSKEDIRNIENIDSVLFYDKDLPEDTCMRLRNWLKSLRPQNRWKPSDEQMKTLKEACDKSLEPDGLDPLYTLYKDLEKLKEE